MEKEQTEGPWAPFGFARWPGCTGLCLLLVVPASLVVTPAPEPGSSLGSRGSLSGRSCSSPAAAASGVMDGPRLGGRGDGGWATQYEATGRRCVRAIAAGREGRTPAARRVGPSPYTVPVEPKPPSPRSVGSSSAHSRQATRGAGWRTSWAIFMPRSMRTGSEPAFRTMTCSSPR